MTDLLARLTTLEQPIKIGIIGIGSVGKGLTFQAQITPGIECVAIADLKLDRAITCAEWLKRDYQVVGNLGELQAAIQRGKLAVCEDGDLIARSELIDVLIESSSSIGAGGQFALTAIEHHRQVVMMNYEADLIFGPYLLHRAQQQGVIYTACDGDQPTVLKRLIDEIKFMGFELVMAGNIKGYLDRYANPTTIIPEADKRGLDYKMCTSYTDGTKLSIEMAVLANGLGLQVDVPGMHGPRLQHVTEVFEHFDFERLWKDKQAHVDYILGAQPAGGVFVIGYTEHQYQQGMLAWFPAKLGSGPFYVFYRPYHLIHFEALRTAAEAVLDRSAVLRPDYGFQTNVYAYAKKDLQAGENLDGLGGYTCYGLIDNVCDNENRPGLPVCLADDVTLKRAVAKDEKIFWGDVTYRPNEIQFDLYAKAVAHSNSLRRKD